MVAKLFFLWVLTAHMFLAPCPGATVRWVGGSGDWGDTSKWSGGATPGQNDDAVIDTSNGAITVTISSGTVQVNSVQCEETLLLNGGTIQGGTVTTDNRGALVVQSGTLDGVTVNGALDVGNTYLGANLSVYNGLVLNGTALVGNPNNGSGSYGSISFVGNQVLGGNGTVIFGRDNFGGWGLSGRNAVWLANGGTTLVIGPGITVRGQNGYVGAYGANPWYGPGNVSVANQGTISADVNGGTITINAQPFVNSGTVAMSNGGSLNINNMTSVVGLSVSGAGTLTLNGNWENDQALSVSGATLAFNGSWINAGTINATNATVNLGGTFTVGDLGAFNAVGSTVNLVGTLNNTNTTLALNGGTGSWVLDGGTILGGTVTTDNGGVLVVQRSGTLDGVTVNGVLDVGNTFSANLTVIKGLVLNGTALVGIQPNGSSGGYGAISFAGNQVLGGSGTVVFGSLYGDPRANALLVADSGTTLVIGPGITVRGQNGTIGAVGAFPWSGPADVSVANQGTVSADVGGGTIAVNAQLFSNQGLAQAVNGGTIVVAGTSFSNAGQLLKSGGGGSITVVANMINTGLVEADHGSITFSGGFTQNVGTVEFGLSSPTDFGQIKLNGIASVGGTLGSRLDGGYLPSAGDSFAVLNYGTNNVAFTNVSLAAGVAWQTNYNQGVLTLVAKGILPLGVTVSPGNQTVAAGSTVNLQATTSGPGPFGYQWRWNGVALAGATNSSLVLSNVTSGASGAYTVEVSNASGSVVSAAAGLSVLAPPAITMEPQSQTVAVGTTVTFQVTATGTPPLFYQWSFNGQALPGAMTASLTLTNVTRAQAGNYSVVVGNAVGSVTSAPLAVLSIATGVTCPGAPVGMVAWWRAEENTSDYAGTNDAVFEGVAGYGPGEVGNAFLLDGVTSHLEVPNNALWALGTNDFTIELWANFSAVFASDMGGDGSTVFIGHDEGPGARNKWFFGFGGGLLYFYVRGPTQAPLYLSQAPFNPTANQWHHLALTKANGIYRTYVNGVQGSAETNGVAVPVANAPLTIGQAQGLFMDGLLDEISLYNRALEASEIQAICQAGAQGKCALPIPPITLEAVVDPSGRLTLNIRGGQTGSTFTIQATSDLKEWTAIGQVLKAQHVTIFTDPTSKLAPWRYYRVLANP